MNVFDSRAKDWDANKLNVERAEAIAKAILGRRRFKPGARALEYGCGTGLLSFAMRKALGRVTLADSSAGMIEVLKEKIKAAGDADMEALLLDLSADPTPEGPYGMIFAQLALHHVKDVRDMLGKFHSLLEDGGLLFIADLDKEDGSFHKASPDFDGHNGFDRQELALTASSAGFKDADFETVYEIRKEIDGVLRSYPIFLMEAKA